MAAEALMYLADCTRETNPAERLWSFSVRSTTQVFIPQPTHANSKTQSSAPILRTILARAKTLNAITREEKVIKMAFTTMSAWPLFLSPPAGGS